MTHCQVTDYKPLKIKGHFKSLKILNILLATKTATKVICKEIFMFSKKLHKSSEKEVDINLSTLRRASLSSADQGQVHIG
ncbi:CLUMA_CG010237, isoform A [Clunio marinus]|uniref:CLUMA_CG010237, isoform A n=1 Tax=Clunio marinus TaxID=568069 RepID=A0A1J1I8Z4_9DIPT|nr:CLUMA_CG010237, isoform A [Clunio marinus]